MLFVRQGLSVWSLHALHVFASVSPPTIKTRIEVYLLSVPLTEALAKNLESISRCGAVLGCPLLLWDGLNAGTKFHCRLYMWPIMYLYLTDDHLNINHEKKWSVVRLNPIKLWWNSANSSFFHIQNILQADFFKMTASQFPSSRCRSPWISPWPVSFGDANQHTSLKPETHWFEPVFDPILKTHNSLNFCFIGAVCCAVCRLAIEWLDEFLTCQKIWLHSWTRSTSWFTKISVFFLTLPAWRQTEHRKVKWRLNPCVHKCQCLLFYYVSANKMSQTIKAAHPCSVIKWVISDLCKPEFFEQ